LSLSIQYIDDRSKVQVLSETSAIKLIDFGNWFSVISFIFKLFNHIWKFHYNHM